MSGTVILALFFLSVRGAAEPSVAVDKRVTIEIGSLAGPASASSWLEKEIKAFAEAHPEIAVNLLSVTEPNRRDFPLTKNPPLPRNIMGIGSKYGYEAPYLATRGVSVPIDDFLPDADFTWDIFYDSYWDAVTFNGKRWGMPWIALTNLLVCDPRILNSIGIENPPRSLDELVSVSQAVTKDTDGDGKTDQWGLRISINDDSAPNLFMSLILQKGGRLISDGHFDLNQPAVAQACDFLHNLITSGAAKIDSRAMDAVLADKSVRYAMHLIPSNRLGNIVHRTNLFLAPVPSWGPEVSACPCRFYFCILRSTPEEERASWNFIKWMCRPDISLPPTFEGYPCRKDFINRKDFAALAETLIPGIQNIYSATEHGADWGEQIIGRNEGAKIIWKTLTQNIMGTEPFQAAADKATSAANALLVPWPVTSSGADFYR